MFGVYQRENLKMTSKEELRTNVLSLNYRCGEIILVFIESNIISTCIRINRMNC